MSDSQQNKGRYYDRKPAGIKNAPARAIIGTESWEAMQTQAQEMAHGIDAGEADYHLNFTDAAQLFGELTPARLALLETLKRLGPVSIYALAKHLGRNYSNVHTDVARLMEHDLIEKTPDARVWVPWEEVQIRVSLGGRIAA